MEAKNKQFLSIKNHTELADYFDLTYKDLAKTIYPPVNKLKYRLFRIKKRQGCRVIASPNIKLKGIQQKLATVLNDIYPVRPAVHGFVKDRSIVTNAKCHLGKNYIFNIDLKDFFGSIHFGRVRNLFQSEPFLFNIHVATILSHICCFNKVLNYDISNYNIFAYKRLKNCLLVLGSDEYDDNEHMYWFKIKDNQELDIGESGKFSNVKDLIFLNPDDPIPLYRNKHVLPQGAPTSPIISNMISHKLDTQLQSLADFRNSTYTRYADDISFSFTCNKSKLPKDIVDMSKYHIMPGRVLQRIIQINGFSINYDKVRLCGKFSRMEVTGLTINEFPNVRRKYVRQLSSMLNAWRNYGYELAEKEYNEKYDAKNRATGQPKSFLHVVRGKLAFLRGVRSGDDPIFNKLAKQFNELVEEKHRFKL